MVQLKYLSSVWRILEMHLINYEINLILSWFANCFIAARTFSNQDIKFSITDTKFYVTLVTLSTGNDVKLL